MGRVSKEKISAIPHNMESYLSLDIGNQRYMDSLQLMPGSLDSHISNLGAEPCKDEVDENGKSLPCKKPGHLYRIDSNRCFAHPERFPITREYGAKGRDDLVFRKAPFPYDWFNTPEKMDTTSLPPIETFDSILNKSKCSEKAYKIAQECEIPDDADKGYILEVDLDYPYKLHKAHTSYPLAPENIEISKEEMSKYDQDLIKELKHYTKTKKLVPNLNNKKKYIVHYRALQFYIKQGVVLTKIHRAIEFNQSPWMKPFMEELARSRALAKKDFEKNMYKLLGNANYGKTVENVRKYQRIDFVRPEGESKKFKKLVADPSYKSHRILAENLVGISRHQSKARLSKPIFIGMSVLDESKITMYNFYYNIMKARYGDNVEVVYTDTDSLILLIRTENVYKDMVEMQEHLDFSDYKPEHPIYQALGKEKIMLNKKVPGKYKDESCGTAMWKFCGPRPKLYSYILADGKTDRRAKGVQKVVVKKNLIHDMYEDCLKSRKETMITMHRLGSKDHIIRLLRSSKIGISPLDTKRWILSDGITTLAFGDWRIIAYKKMIGKGISHEEAEKRMTNLELKPQYQ
ncbi:13913_t:CDS:2 [Acaulospora colombiana]|uniref:13913_t:CDS:1 n=1 Tax=Acaulospora colombiana TaxID=27376 RepID=A0ACA9LXD3_9GLOM|nr:13913_t:CDS:2 [Acaulospora colombiana]